MIEKSVSRRSSRHHRVDEEFVALLHEDFGIPTFSLSAALIGVPSVPKKEAIAICEWAVHAAGDPDKAGDALRAWAKKHGKGGYNEGIVNGPENTFGEGV